MIGVLMIFAVLFLLSYGGWELYKWNNGKKKREFENTFDFKKFKIIETIYNISKTTGQISGMPVNKIAILEKTNLSPKQLKELYSTMVKDELVTDQGAALTLTDFGAKYFEVFLKKKKDV